MTIDRLAHLPGTLPAIVYLAAYLALEWATYVPSLSPLGITPWNPSAGLSVALVLLLGWRYAPLVALAPLLSDMLVRHVALPWWVELLEAVAIAGSTLPILWVLMHPKVGFDRAIASIRDLILLVSAAVISAVAMATSYVGILRIADLILSAHVPTSILRHWGGDVIGILLVTPFLLITFTHPHLPRLTREMGLQALSILAAVLLVLRIDQHYRTQLFYVLFLPIVWIAVRAGLAGVTVGLVLMQVGLMVALHAGLGGEVDVPAFQAMMLILVFSGLAIGVLVSERERAEARVRLQQGAVARAGRIASMGSFGASIAHEINQPLTAIANYARATLHELQRSPAAHDEARLLAAKTVAQVERAREVVRRLRDIIQSGRAKLAPQQISTIITQSLDLLAPELEHNGIRLTVDLPRGLAPVMADALQIQQVLVNLLHNSIEAMRACPLSQRRITVAAGATDDDYVDVRVVDSGPGFPPGFDLDTLLPGFSEKPHGLGIGLSLCRSIIEAHGGQLAFEQSTDETCVRFTLRAAQGDTT